MARPRGKLKWKFENRSYVVRFRHPLRPDRVTRVALGHDQKEADSKLLQLNRVFTDPSQWQNPDLSPELKEVWTGAAAGVKITPAGVLVDGKKVKAQGEGVTAGLYAVIETLQNELAHSRQEATKYRKQLEHVLGRKVRTGPSPTLGEARTNWLTTYVGRDSQHLLTVKSDLKKFVDHFGEGTLLDALDGQELKIDAWLREVKTSPKLPKKEGGKPIPARPLSAGRKQQIRTIVLKFLTESGLQLDRKAISRPSKDDVRADRGPIRWLEKTEASKLSKKLEGPWRDYFRVQVGLGLRPDELITLQRQNFTKDFSRVTLSELEHLTLKQGPRTLVVPEKLRPIIKTRLKSCKIVFPNPNDQKPWRDPHCYNKKYRTALRAAATEAGIATRVDCRTGRRTCGSILLRNGKSAEEVAAILGDTPEMIREHYAAILSHEVDPSAAAI